MLRILSLLWALLLLTAAADCSIVSANASPVIVIEIKGEIDGGQAALVHRAVAEVTKRQAKALIIEIDTFGGLVDSAVKIRDMISDVPVQTICYIKNRAWSAGALIAISHKNIAIAPGGSIGAAEPIPATEKTIAALKAEFSATANKTGRNPRVAEAMVDKSLGFSGYAQPGQILALTDKQAVDVGYADLIAASREAMLAHYGLEGAPVIEYKPGWPEKLVGFLSNPTVKSLLLSIIFLAVMAEIKTAGLGVAALIGLTAAILFFGSQWLTGLAGWLEILLFIGGVILIVIEILTPGRGFFGFAGLLSIFASFFFTLGGDLVALNIMAVSLILAIIIFLFLLKRLPSSKLWSKLVLENSQTTQAGYTSSSDYSILLGKVGTVVTLLRPAGVIEIDGKHVDVVSEGQYLQPGTMVKVVSVSGSRIVVQPVKTE